MSKKLEFVNYVNENLDFSNAPQSVSDFWKAFSTSTKETEKPVISEKGAEILKYIRDAKLDMFKSKDVADGMGLTSRSVSGTLTKLKNDGFLERMSDSPAIYSLTEKGNTFEI